MMTKELFILTMHRELDALPRQTVLQRMLHTFLEKIMIPILALFPEFSLGLHYFGKAFGSLFLTLSKLQLGSSDIAE